MKIIQLKTNPKLYSSNAYLVLGDWNRLEDYNTLIDTGADGYILDQIKEINTGIGKKSIERVVITHSHFDHIGCLAEIKEIYDPKIYAFYNSSAKEVTEYLNNGDIINIGDCNFEVIYIPAHSYDSICLYCYEKGALFSGDTHLNIKTPGGSYPEEFVYALEYLTTLDIKTIYPGHSMPIEKDVRELIVMTLNNVRKSKIISNPKTDSGKEVK